MNRPLNRGVRLLTGSGIANGSNLDRIATTMSDPRIARMATAPVVSSQCDATVQRWLSEAQAASGSLDAAYNVWLSHVTGRGSAPHRMSLSPGDVHIPTIDQNIFVLYQNRDFIADMVMPVVNAAKLSNFIQQVPVAAMQSVANTRIANSRARPNQVQWTVDNSLSYNCIPLGLVDYIPQEILDDADSTALKSTAIYMAILRSFMDLAREVNVAAEVFGASNYGTNTTALSGADRWDNPSSDPIQQLLQYKESVFSTPNVLVMGGQVWPQLMTNPAVKGYISGRASTKSGAVPMQVALETIAELVGVDKVIVGRAKYNSAQEGLTAVSDYVWGKSAALLRVEPNPDPLMTETFGYTYRFGGKAYRNEVIPDRLGGGMGGQYIKLSTFEDDVVIGGANTGYLLTTVIS